MTEMRCPWMIIALSALLAAGCGQRKTSDRDLVLITPADALELMEGRKRLLGLGGSYRAAWVDPRSEDAYHQGHIPGAIHLPFQHVATDHERLVGYDVVVVYGDDYNDPKAEGMSKRLLELGHKDVRTLRGGLRAWGDTGHEVQEGASGP